MAGQVLLLHFSLCLLLCGLIWVVQLVHYPSFKFSNIESFESFTSFHVKNITIIVAPLMILELISGVYLFLFFQDLLSGINLAFILFTWLATIFLSMPIHKKLSSHFDIELISRLVSTNWPRTFCWSFRSILLFTLLLNEVQ